MEGDFISLIKQAGFTQPEAKIYDALLRIKEGTVSDIAKQATIKRSSIYNSIGRLEMLGLISKITHGKRTYYSAVHPRKLLQIATLQQKQIEENLPKMVGAYYGEGEKPQIQMFEGIQAVRDVYKEAFERLRGGEELYIFTNIGRVIELFPEVPTEFKRIIGSLVYRSKVKELAYGDSAGAAYAESARQKTKRGYEIRLTKNTFAFGDNEQFIFKDKIIYFSLQKHIFVVVIENEDLAKTHKVMFEMAWEQADEEEIKKLHSKHGVGE